MLQVQEGMTVTRDTKAKQIMAWYKEHWGALSYRTAVRVLHNILGDSTIEQIRQFTLIPSYTTALLAADPTATVKYKQAGWHFSSLFIAPSFLTNAWPYLQPFLAVDAAFTKTYFNYILLLATGIDANNKAITLAWGLAPKEDTTHWAWFLQNLALALNGLNRPGVVIMSDRQKGLNKAIKDELPLATEGYCCKHIEQNLMKVFGEEIRAAYWQCVYARTREKYEEALMSLRRLNPW
jgi:hypothetical protein